jgi:hypothetical protein
MKRAWQNFATHMDHYIASSIETSLRVLSNAIRISALMRKIPLIINNYNEMK